MRIRRATPNDIPNMQQLERDSETAAHWSAAQYGALFAADAPRRLVLVAADDSEGASILGFVIALCLPEESEIENIIVDGRNRRSGIGGALVRELLAEARIAGVATIMLEVRESNLAARRLYENNGFNPEGRRKGYYREPVEDAILFRIPLQTCDKIP